MQKILELFGREYVLIQDKRSRAWSVMDHQTTETIISSCATRDVAMVFLGMHIQQVEFK